MRGNVVTKQVCVRSGYVSREREQQMLVQRASKSGKKKKKVSPEADRQEKKERKKKPSSVTKFPFLSSLAAAVLNLSFLLFLSSSQKSLFFWPFSHFLPFDRRIPTMPIVHQKKVEKGKKSISFRIL